MSTDAPSRVPEPSYDIAVVGAGLTGAAMAALLAHCCALAPARIVLLSPDLPAPVTAGAPPDLRVVAMSRASETILTRAQAWQRLEPTRLCAYERMRVWHESSPPHSAAALVFDAAELGQPNLGHIVENRELVRACVESFTAAGGTVRALAVQAMAFGRDRVDISAGAEVLSCRLVIGADGAHSLVRACAQRMARVHDYRQRAIVATVATSSPHEATAWQRFLSTGPLALLPLFDGNSSLVWSVDLALAEQLQRCTPTQFAAHLTRASDHVLGACKLLCEPQSFALHSLHANSYVAARCALIGDAAHVVHPLAGQGANLGLLDAAALCEAIARGLTEQEDVGALRVLRRYEQQRRSHNLLMSLALSGFLLGTSAARGPVAWLANGALAGANRFAVAKKLFAAHAMGTAGELPRLARNR